MMGQCCLGHHGGVQTTQMGGRLPTVLPSISMKVQMLGNGTIGVARPRCHLFVKWDSE